MSSSRTGLLRRRDQAGREPSVLNTHFLQPRHAIVVTDYHRANIRREPGACVPIRCEAIGVAENPTNATNEGPHVSVESMTYSQPHSDSAAALAPESLGAGAVPSYGGSPPNDEAPDDETTTAMLMRLAGEARIFRGLDNQFYAEVPAGGHHELHELDSPAFEYWLIRRIRDERKTLPSLEGLKRLVRTLEADAVANGPAELLKEYTNIVDADFPLLIAWMTAALRPIGPYPILILSGEQGSAKSTMARVLRRLIDPSSAELRALPGSQRDLMIEAHNSWLLAYDNVSAISTRLSDARCRIATGGGFSTRALFMDHDNALLDVQRPVLFTGIDETVYRSDMIDRCIFLHLPTIADANRRLEESFWEEFEADYPRLLGALFLAVSAGLRLKDKVQIPELPRMADFAHWGEAVSRGLGWQAGSFLAHSRTCRRNSLWKKGITQTTQTTQETEMQGGDQERIKDGASDGPNPRRLAQSMGPITAPRADWRDPPESRAGDGRKPGDSIAGPTRRRFGLVGWPVRRYEPDAPASVLSERGDWVAHPLAGASSSYAGLSPISARRASEGRAVNPAIPSPEPRWRFGLVC